MSEQIKIFALTFNYISMYKTLFTAIILTIISATAWGQTPYREWDNKDMRKAREERREMRREHHEEMMWKIKDYRKEHRTDIKEARKECREKLEAATTDAEKDTIKAACKKEAMEARAALRENVIKLKAEKFATVVTNLKTQIEGKLDTLKALPADKKVAWKARVNERLDDLEDKAIEKNQDDVILMITAIREIIAGV